MSPPNSNFVRLSFWELLQRNSVQIPVIQRDYAQGRKSKEKVIDDLLGAIRASFSGQALELDFIFGDVKEGVFRPLDGQQRLTTLFLLHWYAARMARLSVDDYRSALGRFSYDTRVSSRDFCQRLIDEPVDVGGLSHPSELSRHIRDYPWFVGTWDFDPTVAGMLAVLDKIAALEWPQDLWERLTLEDRSPICFLLVELEKFGLSDDLYIKMNARGKPLTAFESFKAVLGERVVDEGWEKDLSPEEQFAIRMDTRWTDFFWCLCPTVESGLKRIDNAFLSFIMHSLVCSVARHAPTAEKVADDLQRLLNEPEQMDPERFTASYYNELRGRLELLCEKGTSIRGEARGLWDFSDSPAPGFTSILDDVMQTRGPQYRRRLILYAQMRLHEAAESLSPENMSDWRRVVRNVMTHSVIESAENFVGAIRLLDELAKGIGAVYEFLASAEIQSDFAKEQVGEEQRKARLIQRYPDQRALLHRLEDTYFLRGRISFALDCVDERPNPENFDFARLADIASVLEREFGKGINAEIRRAFLTIGDGSFFRYWQSWFFTKNLPKFCLISDDQDFRSFAERRDSKREALKAFALALIGKTCAQLIAEYEPTPGTPNWRIRLIREEDLILRATHHYIALDEPAATVYPINGKRPRNNKATTDYVEANKIQ